MLLALVLAQAIAIGNPQGPIVSQPQLMGSLAQYEALPLTGLGASVPCAGTAITDARGGTITVARAGNGTCTKTASGGFATSGILPGDLSILGSNVPRVEIGANGAPALLTEDTARRNYMPRSQEWNDATWVVDGTGVVVTADAALAPDGTMTADRFQSQATTGAQISTKYQFFTITNSGAASTCSTFVMGNAMSGTTDLCLHDGAAVACMACPFVAGSYTRCILADAAGTGTTRFCKLGNNSNQNGAIARAANDMFVWGHQGEEGGWASSYIPTVAAAVDRVTESATITMGLTTGSDFSIAESFIGLNPATACAGFLPFNSATGPTLYSCFSNSASFRVTAGGFSVDSAATAFAAFKWLTGIRWGGTWVRSTSTVTAYADGVAGTPASLGTVTSLSWTSTGLTGDGLHNQICAQQNSLTRCR